MKKHQNKQSGFTLVELLIVIAIIGILGSIIATTFLTVRKQARDARRVADMRQLDTAIQEYLVDFNHAPYVGSMDCRSTGGGTCSVIYDTDGGWLELQSDLSPYMSTLPKDPCGTNCGSGASRYAYFYQSPSYLNTVCNATGCTKTPGEIDQMYGVGANNLELTKGKWGFNHGFASSF